MNRTIQIVTEKLSGLLPDNQQNYKPEDLRSWGFPSFIVRRIQVELERNLAESMHLPKTDWANMQSSEVQEVWEQFIIAIRNQAWLPASYARTVIETAVADVLEMLVEPRKNIPQAIFGTDEKLSREQLNERLKILVVYRHFARLLPRYMEKKDIDVLTKERCAEIIKKADEKVIARYTPLNWAQMLEPLFKLMNEQIDSSLLRLFFEDKKMPRIARKFDFMEKSVNRAVLIETLSSPESLNMDGFEEDQSELFGVTEASDEDEIVVKEDFDHEGDSKKEQDPVNEQEQSNGPEQGRNEDGSDDEFEQDLADSFLKKNRPEKPEDVGKVEESEMDEFIGEEEEPTPLSNKSRESNMEIEHEEATINTIFADDNDAEESDVFENGEETEEGLNDYFEEEEAEAEEEEVSTAETEAEDEDEAGQNEQEEIIGPKPEASEDAEPDADEEEKGMELTADEKQETPMWQRFMSSEELEQLAKEEEETTHDDGFIEEPIFDLSMEKEPTEEEIGELKQVLEDKRSYFVEQIFGGSEVAYDEALENIAAKKGWRNASRYIEKEIFKRNMIDMYSEEAVDFTDRMHSYFMDRADS